MASLGYPCNGAVIERLVYACRHWRDVAAAVLASPNAALLISSHLISFAATPALYALVFLLICCHVWSFIASQAHRRANPGIGSTANSSHGHSRSTSSTSSASSRQVAARTPMPAASSSTAWLAVPLGPEWLPAARSAAVAFLVLLGSALLLLGQLGHPVPQQLVPLTVAYAFSSAAGSHFAEMLAMYSVICMVSAGLHACALLDACMHCCPHAGVRAPHGAAC